jgi:asparagine synthase (glutamine-hydrolysing)
VPVGVFLSGGIDSSLIAAIAQKRGSHKIKTFTVGFENPIFDESQHAKAIATHLGTDHVNHMVSDKDLLDVVPKIGEVFDEPFADASQIPTVLLAKTAREHVSVALSGDGADELFYGYSRYQRAEDLWPRIEHVPLWFRIGAGHGLNHLPLSLINQLSSRLSRSSRYGRLGEVIQNVSPLLMSKDLIGAHNAIANGQRLAFFPDEGPFTSFSGAEQTSADLRAILISHDLLNYLPGDILVKTDRCAMAVSLETRSPFLDNRVADKAISLPRTLLRNARGGKVALRILLNGYLPESLWGRPKKGFDAPIGDWLRGPLKSWAEDMLFSSNCYENEALDSKLVNRIWTLHSKGHMNLQEVLWPILMLQTWYSNCRGIRSYDRR